MAGENTPNEPETSTPADPVPTLDVELDKGQKDSGTPWGIIAGAGVLVLALGAGALALTNGDSEIDTAEAQIEEVDDADEAVDPDETESEPSQPVDGETESESTAQSDDAEYAEEAMAAEFAGAAMSDSMYYGGSGASMTVFDGERFASLSNSGDGWMLRTSVDGLEWTETATTGLPAAGYMNTLVIDDGIYAGLMESYDEQNGMNTSTVVSSVDGINWSSAELPGVGENAEAGTSGFTVTNGRVVMLRSIYNTGPDPVSVLADAGILSGDQLEMFCGFDWDGEAGPLDVLICDYIDEEDYAEPSAEEIEALAIRYDEATTDEERNAIERELEELWGGGNEVVATIDPGTPLYEEITGLWFGEGEGEFEMVNSVLSGPLTGPFTVVSDLPSGGYYNGLVEAGGAFFVSSESYDEARGTGSTRILTSTDGSSWTEAGALPAEVGGQLQPLGDSLVLAGYDQRLGTPVTYVSTDGAATWTLSTLDTGLFDAYTMFTTGEAGSVALTMGLLEPYEYFEPDAPSFEIITLNADGYTLELQQESGAFTLIAQDGTIVYELGEEEIWGGENDNIRENPISGNLTFLDAETGDDLVTFTQEHWEEAYQEFEANFDEEDYVEPDQGTRLHFSVDGVTWTELDTAPFGELDYNSNVSTLAVGDDEAIFTVMTWTEPGDDLFAFEMEEREPTPEEIEAIELWESGSENTEYVRIPLAG